MCDIDLTLTEGEEFDLDLAELKSGTPGITPAWGEGLAEAASVCLEDRGHSSPALMRIDGELSGKASVEWEATSDQTRRCWNDDDDATEHGAYGVAALLVPRISQLEVVERSKRGTGFDYWVGVATNAETLFQNRARLEVSGIREGSQAEIAGRARRKLVQTEKSGNRLPALVIVVEFGQPQSRIAKKCQT